MHKASLIIDGNRPKKNGRLPLSYFYPEGGIGFKANIAFPTGSTIVAMLYMDDEVIGSEGIIAWVSSLPEILSTMGIKFLSCADKIKHISRQMLDPCTALLS